MFKGKLFKKQFALQLIIGAKTHLTKIGPVRAAVSDEENWKNSKPLTNEAAEIKQPDYIASFGHMNVNISTRMSPIRLKFSCAIKDKEEREVVVKSTVSCPIIAITNESEWGDAAGKLIISDAFAGQVKKIFPYFLFFFFGFKAFPSSQRFHGHTLSTFFRNTSYEQLHRN